MAKPLLVHPEAQAEAQQAYDYLAQRNSGAALRFAEEIRMAYDEIEQQPVRFPVYPYATGRYRLLDRFPYVIVYEEEPRRITLYAVAHTSRQPGYWKGRRS